MTASDARPPSDTGTTGWHMQARGRIVHRDDIPGPHPVCRPVLVVDPAERDTIARTLADHYPVGYTCGETCDHNLNSPQGWATHVTSVVLAALTDQGQP